MRSAIARASPPESRTMPRPALPGGVEIATTVSLKSKMLFSGYLFVRLGLAAWMGGRSGGRDLCRLRAPGAAAEGEEAVEHSAFRPDTQPPGDGCRSLRSHCATRSRREAPCGSRAVPGYSWD